MLTTEQYKILSNHLISVADIVPRNWGGMQTKDRDRKLPDLFSYDTYEQLNDAIANAVNKNMIGSDIEQHNYYRHRWFLFKCSQVDEFLFGQLPNIIGVEQNPWYDFKMFDRFELDLKGTVLLKQYKDDPEYVFQNPLALIVSFYKQQSQDSYYRKRFQNRLFLVHHSMLSQDREPKLRVNFSAKEIIFKEYAKLLSQPDHKLFPCMVAEADVIFLVEQANQVIQYGFGSENINGSIIFHTITN